MKQIEIDQIKNKLTDDVSQLGKIYKSKKSPFISISIDHNLVDDYLNDGWEIEKILKTKTRLRKPKTHHKMFEDDVWCQFYDLGYRYLNYDDTFKLPYGKEPEDKKQIDIIAIDKETVILIECKSSEKPKPSGSLKTEFEGLERRLDGFRKVIDQVFGKGLKVKYVYATRNIRIDPESIEIERLVKTRSFYYNDNTYEYINSLIKNYKGAARYQFLGLMFKDQLINAEKIEIPAVEGSMGNKKYYMFSLEPHLLLKLGFVLHRTRANEAEMPTYQRLLVPSRLQGIRKFINEGGYFPNSIIINFAQKKHKVYFEPSTRTSDSNSRFGILKIPNAHAIAYIIDGQHRVYGYSDTNFTESNTIPVVAFTDLDSLEQLKIFFDINENQKAVSPSLRGTLQRDLLWDSDKADQRLSALRSSITIELAESTNGPLYNKIEVGEDSAILKLSAFLNGLKNSGLLPKARGNNYIPESTFGSIYNIHNQNHKREMSRSEKIVVQLLNLCYELVEEEYPEVFNRERSLIMSNRGSYAYISLIGSLNIWEAKHGKVDQKSSAKERFEIISKYLIALLDQLKSMSVEEEESLLSKYGSGAEKKWSLNFQLLVNKVFPEYETEELVIWKERQDKDLLAKGRHFGVEIEKFMKHQVLQKIQEIFGDDWELEINSIKRKCLERAEEEKEKNYKEGLGRTEIEWTEMFTINDYKSIIEKYWTRKPEKDQEYSTFQDAFSIDIGEGLGSKAKSIKWISKFNSLRNSWAHEGTKEKGLSKEEVRFLENIYQLFYSNVD
ncbi:MAG: DGQHR domain-containing protein [Roseivirga sp.]|uniref:DGQHR domain-containing protein n=1 Tax=Roseivirga sp. TaxID=1964215 RepID=UPI001B2C678C|nr:DGQHR domain-containing protein [Roseivirga sp.]MBO6659881.1 DGQHR domain-containing protein [Roseivirga sp.]MBO6907382.1 DGQHR domain-containing protein [Roseivirga sp.]